MSIMTIDEKRMLLDRFCDIQEDCTGCPLNGDSRSWCQSYLSVDDIPVDILEETLAKYPIILSSENTATPTTPTTPTNAVDHPSHYNQGGIECIEAMVAAFGTDAVAHFCLCNAFKYIFRCEHKGGHEDLDKAVWYIQKFKELCPDGKMAKDN